MHFVNKTWPFTVKQSLVCKAYLVEVILRCKQNDFGLWMILIHGEVVDGDFPTKIYGVHMSLILTPK
jgi:hypothetical protein